MNLPLAIISGLSVVMFFKCAYDEARSDSKSGTVLMGTLGLVSAACVVMAAFGVGC